jgi:hypothetical protein
MSHFLARLASGVTQSPSSANTTKLRPLVGSIYQPLSLRAVGESAAPSELQAMGPAAFGINSPPLQDPPATASAAKARGPEASGREVNAQPHPAPERSADAHDTRSVQLLQTLIPPQTAASPIRADLPHSLEEPGRSQPAQPEIEPARIEPDRFLLQPPPANPLRLLMPQAAIEPEGRPAQAQAKEPARRAAQPSREPDEIHIHIGRVEVAAISQPAARPAPASQQRKSMSLDEYLRRSNGRPR